MKVLVLRFALALGVAAALAGCVARVEPDPVYGVASADEAPPPVVVASPSIVYEGRPTYYYRDRWDFRSGASWHYYRREPRELYRRRVERR